MAMEAVRDNINTGEWELNNRKRRALDVYYTDRGTKLWVENGALVEESLDVSDPVDGLEGRQWSGLPLPPPPCDEDKVPDLSQTIRTANAALEYYNARHDTKFQLVKPINSCGALWPGGIWFHSNFEAKPMGHEDSCAKPFFAELKSLKDEAGLKYLVTTCRPLDGTKSTDHCELCGDGIIRHPPSGYRHGRYKQKRCSLRPRSNGRVISSAYDNATSNIMHSPTFSPTAVRCPPSYSPETERLFRQNHGV